MLRTTCITPLLIYSSIYLSRMFSRTVYHSRTIRIDDNSNGIGFRVLWTSISIVFRSSSMNLFSLNNQSTLVHEYTTIDSDSEEKEDTTEIRMYLKGISTTPPTVTRSNVEWSSVGSPYSQSREWKGFNTNNESNRTEPRTVLGWFWYCWFLSLLHEENSFHVTTMVLFSLTKKESLLTPLYNLRWPKNLIYYQN